MQLTKSGLVNRAEKYLRTDIFYLAKGGSWTTFGYLLQVGLGVLNTVILANFLAKDLLGTYQFILAMAGVISIFTLSGMGTAVARSVAKGQEEIFRSAVLKKLQWGVVAFLLAVVVSGYYWLQGDSNLALAFIFVAITIPVTESFILYESYLQGKQAFKESVTLGFWRKPLPVLLVFIALYFTSHVPTLIGVYLGTTMLCTLLIYWSVVKRYQPPVGEDPASFKYGVELSVMSILGKAAEHADKVLLWYLLGPIAVASFTIAQLATKYSGGLTGIIAHLALPKVSQRDLPILQQTLPRKVILFTIMLIPAIIIYIVVIPFVFQILFPAYPESIIFAQVLSITIFIVPCWLYGQVLLAHQQTRSLYIISTVAPLTKIFAMFGMIVLFGIWGAVYGFIIGEATLALLMWYFFKTARQNQETDQQSVAV